MRPTRNSNPLLFEERQPANASVLLQAASSLAHGVQSRDSADGRLPRCSPALVSSNATLGGGPCASAGSRAPAHRLRRSPVGAHHDAALEIVPGRRAVSWRTRPWCPAPSNAVLLRQSATKRAWRTSTIILRCSPPPNASVLLQAASSPAHEAQSADEADGRLPRCPHALVSSNATLGGGLTPRAGSYGPARRLRRSPVALVLMLPSRWFLTGAQSRARLLALSCPLQRGAVGATRSLRGAPHEEVRSHDRQPPNA
jgi:hypothetical protein